MIVCLFICLFVCFGCVSFLCDYGVDFVGSMCVCMCRHGIESAHMWGVVFGVYE